jgi:hypothetical protein
VLVFNQWSFAGDSARQSVNQLSLEPFVAYDFNGGWFVACQRQMSADWKRRAGSGGQCRSVPGV